MDCKGPIFLSIVSIHEIQKGISLLQNKVATTKTSALEIWLTGLRTGHVDKILEFDVKAAVASGKIEARALATGTALAW